MKLHRSLIPLVASALLIVLGCASGSTPPAAAPAPRPVAAAAPPPEPAPAAVAEMPADPGSVATVIIYRPKSFFGMALRPTVMLDGADLANITNGRYYKGHFPAGKYLFQMDDKKSGAELDLAPGQTYYFKVEIVPGFWKGGGKMTITAKEQGDYEISQLKPLDANEVINKKFK